MYLCHPYLDLFQSITSVFLLRLWLPARETVITDDFPKENLPETHGSWPCVGASLVASCWVNLLKHVSVSSVWMPQSYTLYSLCKETFRMSRQWRYLNILYQTYLRAVFCWPVPVCPCARGSGLCPGACVPVCPWIGVVPGCPCARASDVLGACCLSVTQTLYSPEVTRLQAVAVCLLIPKTVCPHWGVLPVGVKAGAWSGCSLWSAAFYL